MKKTRRELLNSIARGDVFKITFNADSTVEMQGTGDTFVATHCVEETCDSDLIYGYAREQCVSVCVVNMTNTVYTLRNCSLLMFAEKDEHDTDNNVNVELIASLKQESVGWLREAFLVVVK